MLKKLTALLTVCALGLSAAACSVGKNPENKAADVKLWSALSTTKILRDAEYDVNEPAVLSYEMCKNEVEGAQFIITPANDYEVKEFDVSVSDLTGENGAKISKDKLTIYLQKYINIYDNMTGNPKARTGEHPDALLPFAKAVEYGENKVDGVNQGVYVTVETEADTPAGEYTGSVSVTVDGTPFSVPVKCTVWNFAISDEVHVRSLFDVWGDNLIYGELDSSPEMRKAYNDALLDYRVNANRLVASTLEEYVEEAKKAAADKRVTSYVIPYRGAPNSDPACGLGASLDFDYHLTYLRALAENSTEELCLIDKLVYYFGAIYDEPQFDSSGNQDRQIIYITNKLEELHADLFESLQNEGYFNDKSAAYKEHFCEALENIPNMVTGPYDESYTPGLGTYCPLFDEFHTAEKRDKYAEERALNGEVWWYGCTGPNYPYVTYHIDDNLVGARILNYMMYDYGIDGNLYWCVNYSLYGEMSSTGNITRPVDPYEEVRRDARPEAINGDGYLFYPGVDYGIKGPVGTIRLEAVRDGNEEYEYLYELEKAAKTVSEYYGTEIAMEGMVSNLYKRLYSGVRYVPDEENYFEVRRELAEIIERVGSDEKLVISGIKFNGAAATIEFYASSDYAVNVNGAAVTGASSGEGKKYSVTMNLDKAANYFDIELQKGETVKNYNIFVSGKTTVASDFDAADSAKLVHANDDGITVTYSEEQSVSGGAVKAVIESKFDADNPLLTLTYYPELTFKANEFGFTIKDLEQFNVMVYNGGSEDIEISVYLGAGGSTYKVSTHKLLKLQWNTVTLNNVYLINWKQLGSADRIIFRFSNTVKDENKVPMPTQIVYIDNMLVGDKVPQGGN